MKFTEILTLNDIRKVIKDEVEKTIITKDVSSNNTFSAIYKDKVSQDISDKLIKDNESFVEGFIIDYNNKKENITKYFNFIRKVNESSIKNISVDGEKIYIDLGNNVKLVLTESEDNLRNPNFTDNFDRHPPTISVFLFKEKMFDLKKAYTRNLKGLEEIYKLDNINIGIKENEINKFLEDNQYVAQVDPKTALINILDENIINPLKEDLKNETLEVELLKMSTKSIFMLMFFDEYKNQVKKITNEKPLTQLIQLDELGEELLNKVRSAYEKNKVDSKLPIKEKEQIVENKKNKVSFFKK